MRQIIPAEMLVGPAGSTVMTWAVSHRCVRLPRMCAICNAPPPPPAPAPALNNSSSKRICAGLRSPTSLHVQRIRQLSWRPQIIHVKARAKTQDRMAACIVLLTFCDVAGNGIPDNTDAYMLHQQVKIQIFCCQACRCCLVIRH